MLLSRHVPRRICHTRAQAVNAKQPYQTHRVGCCCAHLSAEDTFTACFSSLSLSDRTRVSFHTAVPLPAMQAFVAERRLGALATHLPRPQPAGTALPVPLERVPDGCDPHSPPHAAPLRPLRPLAFVVWALCTEVAAAPGHPNPPFQPP